MTNTLKYGSVKILKRNDKIIQRVQNNVVKKTLKSAKRRMDLFFQTPSSLGKLDYVGSNRVKFDSLYKTESIKKRYRLLIDSAKNRCFYQKQQLSEKKKTDNFFYWLKFGC
jgi:hypothetical protein